MIQSIVVAARDRARLTEVLRVVTGFGLDSLVARLGLGESPDDPFAAADLPTRTRRALEALGPTYIKLGQILATRRDLLPDPWIEALEHLQSAAPTVPFDALRDQVEAGLGEPVETAFAAFDTTPLAAASIAQVHRARLHDGREVVVKIRRPGIRALMEADLRLIRHLAALIESGSAEARRFQPAALVDQLARDILDELDFSQEGSNADRLRSDFAGNDRVVIPAIHWPWTGEDVLVMDFIAGLPPRDPQALRTAGIDPARIADLGASLVLDMVLIHGRFHGDPHPGNLLCLPGDRLSLLDLGSVGVVTPRRQHEFLTFVVGLRSGDPQAVADMLATWSKEAPVSRDRILDAAERLVARHGSGPLVLNTMVADFFPLLRKEGLVLPPDLLLIFKALVTMDGVLARIEPGFDLSTALQAIRGKLVAARIDRLAPRSGWKRCCLNCRASPRRRRMCCAAPLPGWIASAKSHPCRRLIARSASPDWRSRARSCSTPQHCSSPTFPDAEQVKAMIEEARGPDSELMLVGPVGWKAIRLRLHLTPYQVAGGDMEMDYEGKKIRRSATS